MIDIGGHTFLTWCVAHALHPLLWIMGIGIISPDDMGDSLTMIFPVCIIALFASIPAIFVFWGIVYVIVNTSFQPLTKLILWILCAPVIVTINAMALLMLMGDVSFTSEAIRLGLLFATPSVIATLLSVIIRWRQFLTLNEEVANAKIVDQQLKEHAPQS